MCPPYSRYSGRRGRDSAEGGLGLARDLHQGDTYRFGAGFFDRESALLDALVRRFTAGPTRAVASPTTAHPVMSRFLAEPRDACRELDSMELPCNGKVRILPVKKREAAEKTSKY